MFVMRTRQEGWGRPDCAASGHTSDQNNPGGQTARRPEPDGHTASATAASLQWSCCLARYSKTLGESEEVTWRGLA